MLVGNKQTRDPRVKNLSFEGSINKSEGFVLRAAILEKFYHGEGVLLTQCSLCLYYIQL